MISFYGFAHRSSGIVRGEQVAIAIQDAEFIDIDHAHLPQNRITLQVRKFDASLAKRLKSRGNIVGYEMSDHPVTQMIYGKFNSLAQFTSELCDFYVVNNDVYAAELRTFTDKPIYVIPHHSCNLANRTKVVAQRPTRAAYIGTPDYTVNKEQLKQICSQFGISYEIKNTDSIHELDTFFDHIDVGLVYFDAETIGKNVYDAAVKYKPNVKVTNFLSYGIPVICLPYESYKQFGEGKAVIANNFEEIENALKSLIIPETYVEACKDAYDVGRRYHISNIVNYYKKIVDDFHE